MSKTVAIVEANAEVGHNWRLRKCFVEDGVQWMFPKVKKATDSPFGSERGTARRATLVQLWPVAVSVQYSHRNIALVTVS